jgi:NAD+ synthase (glutamine-hydrolysing)
MHLAHSLGLLRAAVVTPAVRVADVRFNLEQTIAALQEARSAGAALAVFPELGLTGYSCGDLFHQHALLDAAAAALAEFTAHTARLGIAALIGLPLRAGGRLFNCAAFVAEGRVLGFIPKTHLPNQSEFYEERWFSAAHDATVDAVRFSGADVPFGPDLLFHAMDLPGCVVGVELCEDLWAVQPPSGALALAGATVLLNPSASTEVLGKAHYRRALVANQSARCLAAYLYAAAGPGESTMDVVFGGHSLIAENGAVLAETQRFSFETQIAVADVDLQRIAHERMQNHTFATERGAARTRSIELHLHPPQTLPNSLLRPLAQTPFVPADPTQRAANCEEIFAIQASGLAKRLRHTGAKNIAIGISGGLDSTLALLVACRAFDMLGLDRAGICAITMPGFGTTDRTYANALGLMKNLGVAAREIPIAAAVRQHFADIGHSESQHDVTYENSQARERTQILMDMANRIGGFVVGTGDLSEAALGWMTFNGDHMSMYHVNAGVPKTLVRYLITWAAEAAFGGETAAILLDIVDTPITPELLPLDKDGRLQQQTEDTVGPYVLHDFFLFYVVRYGFAPRKVFFLAQHAFAGKYTDAVILKWLRTFYRRFFSQQFKRSAMPDGPKVGSVALSPRGDWRMPSDAVAALWLQEMEDLDR